MTRSARSPPGSSRRCRFDYDGDNLQDLDTAKFDAQLAAAAQLYQPSGCADPDNIRLVLSADFNEGCLDGTGTPVDRFKWAVDKPGKRMFFVGWVHKESPVQDPAINTLVGASVPNQIPMYDDGTNGDEASGDGIWTVAFEVPVDPGAVLRLGYKYTWGLRGQVWTGSEEWPGNSRIIEVLDAGPPGVPRARTASSTGATSSPTRRRTRIAPTSTPAPEGPSNGTPPCTAAGRRRGSRSSPARRQACLPAAPGWASRPRAIGPLKVACTAVRRPSRQASGLAHSQPTGLGHDN
ncbi:MAG: hypothetical protein IPO09_04490 [Anaeromyxobacter sp.]|nr:hypothetical protein [Anaeromyxobacter sp.]